MSESLNPLNPTAQHLKRLAIAVVAPDTNGRPTAYLVNNVCRAFGRSQSVPNAVPEGANCTAFRVMCPKSFGISGTRRVGFMTGLGALLGKVEIIIRSI